MELNFSELDKGYTMNPYETSNNNSYENRNRDENQDGGNYWEKSKTQETPIKKKKVSFNDILTNMNLVVNKQGVLQFMAPTQEEPYNPPAFQNNNNHIPNENPISNFNQHIFPQSNIRQPQQNKNSEQIDPSVKHSYIYNKYFKDYSHPNVEKPVPRVPKTIEEYYQMLIDDKKMAIERKLRIDQIKSKKLLFTTSPDAIGVNPRNIIPTKNNLRSMNFR
jgi:hypothetical protein